MSGISATTVSTPVRQLSLKSPAGRWVLAATVAGSALSAIDSTVVGVALPRIGREFHSPISTLQWIVTGYTLTLAAGMLAGGGLGDQLGRRKLFVIGVVWFTIASGTCAVAPTATVLIVLRVLQGAGAALLVPGSLAIIQSSFLPEERAPRSARGPPSGELRLRWDPSLGAISCRRQAGAGSSSSTFPSARSC